MLDFLKNQIANFLDPRKGTRFKFGLALAMLMALEALLTVVWKSFPLTTVCGFQAGLYVTYVTGKTTNNANYSKTNGATNGTSQTQ